MYNQSKNSCLPSLSLIVNVSFDWKLRLKREKKATNEYDNWQSEEVAWERGTCGAERRFTRSPNCSRTTRRSWCASCCRRATTPTSISATKRVTRRCSWRCTTTTEPHPESCVFCWTTEQSITDRSQTPSSRMRSTRRNSSGTSLLRINSSRTSSSGTSSTTIEGCQTGRRHVLRWIVRPRVNNILMTVVEMYFGVGYAINNTTDSR